MGKRGPKGPSIYQRDFHPRSFVELSKQGKCLAQIARDWDISRDTIYAWSAKYPKFSDAVKKGKELCEAWYIDIGQAAMVGKAEDRTTKKAIKVDLGFYVWMTKNICKWSEKVEQQIDTNTPINVTLNLGDDFDANQNQPSESNATSKGDPQVPEKV